MTPSSFLKAGEKETQAVPGLNLGGLDDNKQEKLRHTQETWTWLTYGDVHRRESLSEDGVELIGRALSRAGRLSRG